MGDNGAIDLAAAPDPQDIHERPTRRISGDAWVADRDRRSLAPTAPPPARPETAKADEASPALLHAEVADCFALGDYARSLSAAELLLGLDPEDENARQYAVNSRARLEARCLSRIGSLDYVFNLAVPSAKVKWLGLDPQAAFLLSFGRRGARDLPDGQVGDASRVY